MYTLWQIQPFSLHIHFIADITHTRNNNVIVRDDALQSQNAVSAYFTNKQIIPFGFARQNTGYSSEKKL